jgi:hypothetical protein
MVTPSAVRPPSHRDEAAARNGNVDTADDCDALDPERGQAPLAQQPPQEVERHDRAAAE